MVLIIYKNFVRIIRIIVCSYHYFIGLGVLALLIICLGVHYYNKANCTNFICSQEKIDPEKDSEKFIKKVKQEKNKSSWRDL